MEPMFRKGDGSVWAMFGLSFLGYTAFMFYVLTKAKHGDAILENPADFNKLILKSILIYMFVKIIFDKKNKEGHISRIGELFFFLVIGMIFPVLFFLLIISK